MRLWEEAVGDMNEPRWLADAKNSSSSSILEVDMGFLGSD